MHLNQASPTRLQRRAAAAVELALILPVLVTIVLGTIDLGRFAYNYIAVANAARAGVGYGSMNNYTSATYSTWAAGVTQAARDEMTQQVGSGNIDNLTVTVTVGQDSNGLRRVQVTAQYPFTLVVPWTWGGLGLPSSLNLQQQAQARLIR